MDIKQHRTGNAYEQFMNAQHGWWSGLMLDKYEVKTSHRLNYIKSATSEEMTDELTPVAINLLHYHLEKGGPAAQLARPFLALNGYREKEEAYVPSEEEKRKSQFFVSGSSLKQARLYLFPNPAGEFSTLDYELIPMTEGSLLLIVRDIQGRLMLSQVLKNEKDQVLIPLEGLKAGTYLVSIEQDNLVLGTEVLEVKR